MLLTPEDHALSYVCEHIPAPPRWGVLLHCCTVVLSPLFLLSLLMLSTPPLLFPFPPNFPNSAHVWADMQKIALLAAKQMSRFGAGWKLIGVFEGVGGRRGVGLEVSKGFMPSGRSPEDSMFKQSEAHMSNALFLGLLSLWQSPPTSREQGAQHLLPPF